MALKVKFVVLFLIGVAARPAAALQLDLQLVTANVTNPVFVTHAGDDSGRVFIIEQAGRIKIFNDTNVLSPAFLDIGQLLLFSGEQGLLSMAFHPGYRTNGQFYVYFTNPNGSSNVVARFTASPPSANTVNANTLTTVLRISHPNESNHNGGQIQFGPDGFLYIATGDGGNGCDPPNNAQNLGSLLGKMLRIDVNNFATNYTIPSSNPFVGSNGILPEIWAYGLRNPWRFSFDRLTGDLFIGDVGQGSNEEVDVQLATSTGGENYGWRLYEGASTNTCSVTFSNVPTVLPIIVYDHGFGHSITGGYRYRGNGISPLFGTYIFGDYFSPVRILGATTNASGAWITNQLVTGSFNVSSFGEDQSGQIYVCRHQSAPDGVYRIVWRDSDGDGMADEWETDNLLNPNDPGDATSDLDGDGFSNLQEFLAGTNPRNAADAMRITDIRRLGDDYVINFSSATNKLYRVETADDLPTGTWGVVTNNVLGTGGVLSVTIVGTTPATNRFYRVRLLP